jgi:hypothetical protein
MIALQDEREGSIQISMFRTHARGMRNDARSGSSTCEPWSPSDTSFQYPHFPSDRLAHLSVRATHSVGAMLDGTCALMDQSCSYRPMEIRGLVLRNRSQRMLQWNEDAAGPYRSSDEFTWRVDADGASATIE